MKSKGRKTRKGFVAGGENDGFASDGRRGVGEGRWNKDIFCTWRGMDLRKKRKERFEDFLVFNLLF